jgi:hypothetical protein
MVLNPRSIFGWMMEGTPIAHVKNAENIHRQSNK